MWTYGSDAIKPRTSVLLFFDAKKIFIEEKDQKETAPETAWDWSKRQAFTKQRGPDTELKEPQYLFCKDHLAKACEAPLALRLIHLKDQLGWSVKYKKISDKHDRILQETPASLLLKATIQDFESL